MPAAPLDRKEDQTPHPSAGQDRAGGLATCGATAGIVETSGTTRCPQEKEPPVATQPPVSSRPFFVLEDRPVDRKIVLSGLWVAMMFVFAYVDIFGFWRADVIKGALAGEVPGVGFEIDQRFLVLITLYVLIPSLMVAASLMLPARVNRVTQLVVAPLYLLSIVVACLGETWVYFLLGSGVEILLLALMIWLAFTWPRVLTSYDARVAAHSRTS